MQENYFEERGIYYRVNGIRQERKTLVFIHGLSGSSSAWFPYEKLFENKYNLLTFDLRGHGKSKRWARFEDYDISKFSEDIVALLKHLSIERCIVVSHSFGALVTLMLLKKYPEKFSRAIFLSPTYGTGKLLLSYLKHLLPALGVCIILFLALFRKPGGQTDYTKYTPTGDWNMRRIYADVSNTGPRSYLFSLEHLYSFPNEEWRGTTAIPTLIVHGEKDSMVPPKNAVALSKILSNAKLILLKDANHILVLNNVPEVSDAIENFITNIPTSSSM